MKPEVLEQRLSVHIASACEESCAQINELIQRSNPDPPAEAFYLKHGYVDTGRRIPSRIEGGPEFSIFKKTY